MPDFEKLWNIFWATLKLVFGEDLSPAAKKIIGVTALTFFSLAALWFLLWMAWKIVELIKEKFWPLFYDEEAKRLNERRRRFASHIENEIRQLNNKESWHDYRFAELEAEVEAQGRRHKWRWLPFLKRTQSGLRREKSLTRALEKSDEQRILLEGEPGSGKSVALRFVAQQMAERARQSRNNKCVIPIYVNLKELRRKGNKTIDRNLIEEFILQSLNRVNDSDVEEFLEQEFKQGMQKGTWLFLFDSFDELPEVLSATEADETIKAYGQALADFLGGMNTCRGIIASREYRGPKMLDWPCFRILALKEERQKELIRLAGLPKEQRTKLLGQLAIAGTEMVAMASNPMFLSLLCEYIRRGNPFPEHPHMLFEDYFKERLRRDENKLKNRYKLSKEEVQEAAEKIAFCMTAFPGLGLSVLRHEIKTAADELGLPLGKRFNVLLDALEYIKFARTDATSETDNAKSFTFAHRRFQEYFATCIVLREPDRIPTEQLLTDARWRETAVVICQYQHLEALTGLFEQARRLLSNGLQELWNWIDYQRTKDETKPKVEGMPGHFFWPKYSLHILSLLQEGFRGRVDVVPEHIRKLAAEILTIANQLGVFADLKQGLEVAGIAPQETLLELIRRAYNSHSSWIRDVAFTQAAKLAPLPEDIAAEIRRAFIDSLAIGELRKKQTMFYAYVSRLPKPESFIKALKLLLWIWPFHLLIVCTVQVVLAYTILQRFWIPASPSINTGARLLMNFWFTVMLLSPVLLIRHCLFTNSTFEVREKEQFWAYYLFPAFLSIFLSLLLGLQPIKILALLCIYLHLWIPAAQKAAIKGTYTQWYYAPVLPLLIFGIGTLNALKKALTWLIHNKQTATKGIIVGLLFLLFASTFSAIVMLPFIFHNSSYTWVGAIFSSLVVVTMFTLTTKMIYEGRQKEIEDKKQWKRYLSTHLNSLSGSQFIDFLFEYKTYKAKKRFLWFVRTRSLLIANSETEATLAYFSSFIEREPLYLNRYFTRDEYLKALTERSKKGILWSKTEKELTAQLERECQFQARMTIEFLDELSMLLEQVRANRKDSNYPDIPLSQETSSS